MNTVNLQKQGGYHVPPGGGPSNRPAAQEHQEVQSTQGNVPRQRFELAGLTERACRSHPSYLLNLRAW